MSEFVGKLTFSSNIAMQPLQEDEKLKVLQSFGFDEKLVDNIRNDKLANDDSPTFAKVGIFKQGRLKDRRKVNLGQGSKELYIGYSLIQKSIQWFNKPMFYGHKQEHESDANRIAAGRLLKIILDSDRSVGLAYINNREIGGGAALRNEMGIARSAGIMPQGVSVSLKLTKDSFEDKGDYYELIDAKLESLDWVGANEGAVNGSDVEAVLSFSMTREYEIELGINEEENLKQENIKLRQELDEVKQVVFQLNQDKQTEDLIDRKYKDIFESNVNQFKGKVELFNTFFAGIDTEGFSFRGTLDNIGNELQELKDFKQRYSDVFGDIDPAEFNLKAGLDELNSKISNQDSEIEQFRSNYSGVFNGIDTSTFNLKAGIDEINSKLSGQDTKLEELGKFREEHGSVFTGIDTAEFSLAASLEEIDKGLASFKTLHDKLTSIFGDNIESVFKGIDPESFNIFSNLEDIGNKLEELSTFRKNTEDKDKTLAPIFEGINPADFNLNASLNTINTQYEQINTGIEELRNFKQAYDSVLGEKGLATFFSGIDTGDFTLSTSLSDINTSLQALGQLKKEYDAVFGEDGLLTFFKDINTSEFSLSAALNDINTGIGNITGFKDQLSNTFSGYDLDKFNLKTEIDSIAGKADEAGTNIESLKTEIAGQMETLEQKVDNFKVEPEVSQEAVETGITTYIGSENFTKLLEPTMQMKIDEEIEREMMSPRVAEKIEINVDNMLTERTEKIVFTKQQTANLLLAMQDSIRDIGTPALLENENFIQVFSTVFGAFVSNSPEKLIFRSEKATAMFEKALKMQASIVYSKPENLQEIGNTVVEAMKFDQMKHNERKKKLIDNLVLNMQKNGNVENLSQQDIQRIAEGYAGMMEMSGEIKDVEKMDFTKASELMLSFAAGVDGKLKNDDEELQTMPNDFVRL